MGYERIQKPEGLLYHYTRKENLESIFRDGRIRKFCDRETWFTKSLADTLRLMSLTVMQEGAAYYDARGRLQRYPAFVPEDYVVLELTPRYQSGEWVIWNQELPPNAPEPELSAGVRKGACGGVQPLKTRIPWRFKVLGESCHL